MLKMQTRAHLNDGKRYGSMNMIHGQDKVKQNKTVEKETNKKNEQKTHTKFMTNEPLVINEGK